MVFVENWEFLHPFFLAKMSSENAFMNVLYPKKTLPDCKKSIELKMPPNIYFFKLVSPKFCHSFFLAKMGQEKLFIMDTKTTL